MEVVEIKPENIRSEGLFCIKNRSNPGFGKKESWYRARYKEGLRILILKNEEQKPAAFIEYVPGTHAWRPVRAPGFMFIHCMMTTAVKDRERGYATRLLGFCENDARSRGLKGICTFTSKGTWMAGREVFLKNGFQYVDKKGRFELYCQQWADTGITPSFTNWTDAAQALQGWHLFYADQCPWHDKSVTDISSEARKMGISMNVHKVESAMQAQNCPSGSGVFALVKDGMELADHYISRTRFQNIVKKMVP